MNIITRRCLASAAMAGVLGWSVSAQASVTAFDVQAVTEAYPEHGDSRVAGYEKIEAVASFAVDPDSPRASKVVDIDRVPVNEQGEVVFSTDVVILRPKAQGTGMLVYDIPNRGRNLMFPLMNLAEPDEAFSVQDPGDGFLMRQGDTMVWSGWQTHLGDKRIALELPVAEGVAGMSREEFIFDNHEPVSVATLSYPAANQQREAASLTVRPTPDAPRQVLEGLSFRYLDDTHIEIVRPESMDGGAIYEFIYPARDAEPSGLGMLATSDLVSFLRGSPGHDVPSPLDDIAHTMALGISQSGRFLRDLIYQGYNADASGNRVFDGAMVHIAGSRKTFTNYRFAQPGRFSRQHEDHDAPGDQFPFSYVETEDPYSGRRDSILAACRQTETCPRLMHTDTSAEFWQARASLVSTSPQGQPLRMPDDVRLYFFSGAPHFNAWGAQSTTNDICQYPTNPLSVAPSMRALIRAMQAWVMNDQPPPASHYPGLAGDDTLVAPGALDLPAFYEEVPEPPINTLLARRHDVLPPSSGGSAYSLSVPRVDEDGIDLGGIRQPYVAAPLGSYLGWNLRDEGYAKGQLCNLAGSFIAFGNDTPRDPRTPVRERYPTAQAYREALNTSIEGLVEEGLMLDADRSWVLEQAPRW